MEMFMRLPRLVAPFLAALAALAPAAVHAQLRVDISSAVVLIDTRRTAGHAIDALADYVAFVILARVRSVLADVAHDLEAAGHILQNLGHVLAKRRHRPAARAAAIGMRSGVDDLVARQMVGQRLSIRPGGLPCPGGRRHRRSGDFRLTLLQP